MSRQPLKPFLICIFTLLCLIPMAVAEAFFPPQAQVAQEFKNVVQKESLVSKMTTTSMNPTVAKIEEVFPGAMPNRVLVAKVTEALRRAGFTKQNTLVATSLCSDELARPLENAFGHQYYGQHFSMGGLAGFPFGGKTAFGAMSAHVPRGGRCLVIYGPHVGVDSKGTVGTVERKGCPDGGPCCGSGTAACNHILKMMANPQEATASPNRGVLDAQQGYVVDLLTPFAERLARADNVQVALTYSLQESQQELIETIVQEGASGVTDGWIAVLGGIQLNTPPDMEDYFWVKHLDLYDNKGVKRKVIKLDY